MQFSHLCFQPNAIWPVADQVSQLFYKVPLIFEEKILFQKVFDIVSKLEQNHNQKLIPFTLTALR